MELYKYLIIFKKIITKPEVLKMSSFFPPLGKKRITISCQWKVNAAYNQPKRQILHLIILFLLLNLLVSEPY